MAKINTYGDVPRTLLNAAPVRKLAERGLIEEIGGEGADGYWVYLTPGWINPDLDCHFWHEYTVADTLRAIRNGQPETCECDECSARVREQD